MLVCSRTVASLTMAPAKRQLAQFLPILFLTYTTQMKTTVPHLPLTPDEGVLVQSAVTKLLSGPLSGQDLLLVTDDHTQRLLDLDQVVEAAGTSLTAVFLATQHSLLHTPRPAHHTKGTLLTALLLFHQDPTDFLLLLADNTYWNPSYLVLFCLNPNLNTTTVLSQPVVQRSHFILLLQPVGQVARQQILAFTSLPFQHNARGHSLVKSSLGVWNPDKFHSRCGRAGGSGNEGWREEGVVGEGVAWILVDWSGDPVLRIQRNFSGCAHTSGLPICFTHRTRGGRV
ncbi:hypothetical protein Pmani_014179 [Petrolisthes manimaculis]|uniref:Uncharacterized protein n=1 Tax=Petrolisthes manimaculis TaxID=1843537 RepID=A0AAE1PW16_9EUCA|nr:hypothetical protein Pmani_014179 [Petrolisthes manimaculis]